MHVWYQRLDSVIVLIDDWVLICHVPKKNLYGTQQPL